MKLQVWCTSSIITMLQIFCMAYLLNGCDEDRDFMTAAVPPRLQLVFAPGTQEPLDITRVCVIFDDGQRNVPQQEFSVKAGTTEIDLDLVVPTDAHRIRIEAFKPGVPEPAFTGESSVSLEEISAIVTIRLAPTTALIKFRPSKSEIRAGEIFDLEIELRQVANLFAITFELAVDETSLEVVEVTAGNFWEGEILILADHQFARRQPGRLNIGITRTGTPQELSGSGVIGIVHFQAKQAGETRLQLLNNSKLSIQQLDGSPVEGFGDLIRFLRRADTSLLILP